MILALALLVLAFTSEQFFTVDNLLNQGRLACEVGLVALPMTYIIITGGIDLSAGSTLGLCAIMLGVPVEEYGPAARAGDRPDAGDRRLRRSGERLDHHPGRRAAADRHPGDPGPLPRARRGHQPGALGTRLSGLVLRPGPARPRRHPGPALAPGRRRSSCSAIVLARTSFGRTLYAIGNNETASRFSGLPVDRAKLIIYGLSGLMSGLAAWIFVSRVSTTRSDMGTGLELDVIAAVVLGGTSIFGGTGSILGTVLGVVLVQLLKNGLALTGVKGDATIVVIGAGADPLDRDHQRPAAQGPERRLVVLRQQEDRRPHGEAAEGDAETRAGQDQRQEPVLGAGKQLAQSGHVEIEQGRKQHPAGGDADEAVAGEEDDKRRVAHGSGGRCRRSEQQIARRTCGVKAGGPQARRYRGAEALANPPSLD